MCALCWTSQIRKVIVVQVFTSYFRCTVHQRKAHLIKVTPPQAGHGIWHWARLPFFVHKVCPSDVDVWLYDANRLFNTGSLSMGRSAGKT